MDNPAVFEIAMNSLSFFLAGLTLFMYGLAIPLASVYPRWLGLLAMVSGAAFHGQRRGGGLRGFGPSIIRLVAFLLLAVWTFIMAFLMWRNGSRRRIARLESASMGAAKPPASER